MQCSLADNVIFNVRGEKTASGLWAKLERFNLATEEGEGWARDWANLLLTAMPWVKL